MTPGELAAEAARLSAKIDAGVSVLAAAARRCADAEHAYRRAKARAWLEVDGSTVPARQAAVDGVCADLRLVRDVAEGERLAALEALRSRRQQASLLQSIAAAYRAEAEHAKYGIQDTP